MKSRPEAMETGVEYSENENLYATKYTAEEDNTLHYGRIFLTELRTTPPVAANLPQPPQQYANLLRFPVDQAVRLFDDADGNARWISEDALYMHERVIQQDRVRLHPAADPIETILQRAETARDAGAEPHLEGLSSYLRDAPAIRRPTIEDLLAEILEDPAGYGMFADLVEDVSSPGTGDPPVAPQFQATYVRSAPSSDSYSIANAVREGRRTNERFQQQNVPSAAGLATPMVPQQTSASHPSLPSLPVNATPLRQVSDANELDTATAGQSSIRGVERVRNGSARKPDTAHQSFPGSAQRSGLPLRRPTVSANESGQQLLHPTPGSRSTPVRPPAQARMSDFYPDLAAQDAQRQRSSSGSSRNATHTDERLQAPRQMSK